MIGSLVSGPSSCYLTVERVSPSEFSCLMNNGRGGDDDGGWSSYVVARRCVCVCVCMRDSLTRCLLRGKHEIERAS